ncbi:MAG: CinA family protein [Marinosulfonomonas sp.]|nr:CinA family protein [Marinosulfonomonas sp.]
MKLSGEVLANARARGVKIATAESCTGGLIGGALTEVPGSSDVFDRGFITYSNEAKTDLLGVDARILKKAGAVSERVATLMAEGALRNSNAGLCVAVTGIAGPGAAGPKPEGLVCFALAGTGRETVGETVEFGALGRHEVRQATVTHALKLLNQALI